MYHVNQYLCIIVTFPVIAAWAWRINSVLSGECRLFGDCTHYHSQPITTSTHSTSVIKVQRFGWPPTLSFSHSKLQTTQQAYGMWTQGILWWSTLDTVGQWTPLHFIQLSTMPAPRLVIPRPMYGGVQWTPPPCRDSGAPVTLLLRRQWAVSW